MFCLLTRIRDGWRRFFGRGVLPHQTAFTLLNPLRKLILNPNTLVQRLRLKSNHTVLEVGPGPGYFSVDVAKALTEGHLHLCDIQPEMLAKAKARLEAAGISNVSFHEADASKLPFDSEQMDVVFLVAVLGEVEEQADCLAEVFRVLRPGGRLSITEQPGDPDLVPQHQIRELAHSVGFSEEETFGSGRNFTVNFQKPV